MKKKDLKNSSLRTRVTNLNRVGNLSLFETLKVQSRTFQNLEYHNERFNRSRFELFGLSKPLRIENVINIPEELSNEIYKCRISYSRNIEKTEFELYQPRNIQSLKIIEKDDIIYDYKFADRSKINELYTKKGKYDDILIVKNGLITDTSFANIVFWDGTEWFTSSTPLLKGTKRTRLIQENEIKVIEIKVNDLHKYKKAKIINAMIDLSDSQDIEMNNIT